MPLDTVDLKSVDPLSASNSVVLVNGIKSFHFQHKQLSLTLNRAPQSSAMSSQVF